MSLPAVGDRAPEIALPDDTGTIHRLSDRSGRWTVLYFYPADDTPGCTKQACNYRDNISQFQKLNVQVLGISADDLDSHDDFIDKFRWKNVIRVEA